MMLRNRPAADELADVRSEIRVLKAREQILRDQVLNDPGSRNGVTHEVVIKRQKSRVFCRDRLPGYVARDPAFWDEKVTKQVTVRERHCEAPDIEPRQARAIRPGDPIGVETKVDTFCLVAEDTDSFDVFERFGR